jgi:hypothetical protein
VRDALYLSTLLLAACGSPPAPQCELRTSLVDHASVRLTPIAEDPFVPTEPGRGACMEREVYYELFGVEPSVTIDTFDCSWATAEWSAVEAVSAGEPLNVRIWYFSQMSFEVAEAEVLVAVGGDVLYRTTVPLPATSGGLLAPTVPAPVDIPAGAPLRWHLSNHGPNTWNLIELTVSRMGPCVPDGG